MRRITFLLATLLLLGACKEAKKASDRTASPYQELADQYAEFPPVSYTHLTLPTICSV